MIPIYYDVATKIAYYEHADGSLIIKTNYGPTFKELFEFYLSSGRKTLICFWLQNNETLSMKYSSIECFLRDAIYLMGYDPQRYTTKTGRILVTEVKNFLEDYYIKKESQTC